MKKILIIQTAFIGDVILSTSLVEKLKQSDPEIQVDFLLRKGNEGVLSNNPHIQHIYIWDKKKKYASLFQNLKEIRKNKYDWVINCQRFFTSGIFTLFCGAKKRAGFKKNPLSLFFHKRVAHDINSGIHEVERNQKLISHLTDNNYSLPKMYPGDMEFRKIESLAQLPYVCIAPTSVWFTKQFAKEKWVELIVGLPLNLNIYLIGSLKDRSYCNTIKESSGITRVCNLCGDLSLIETSALMKNARVNYVNDSAPLHIASSVHARVVAIFCSTIPQFGFGPLSMNSKVVESQENLPCRPCGLHGKKKCPEGHFHCALTIDVQEIIKLDF